MPSHVLHVKVGCTHVKETTYVHSLASTPSRTIVCMYLYVYMYLYWSPAANTIIYFDT